MGEGRSLADTPTWLVATVTTVMVFVCLLVERSIHRLGKWLKKTKRKAMLAALQKIREDLMLLGLISLMLRQTARCISGICVPSSLFSSRFYICSENDVGSVEPEIGSSNLTEITSQDEFRVYTNHCPEDHEPFVSFEGLEQLHLFLFVLGITHVIYSFATVALSMIKIYSWRNWEEHSYPLFADDLQARRNRVMQRQSTFVFHHASHPWSKNKVLIWMLCFIRQFRGSIGKSDYRALRLDFITNHKLPPTYNFHKFIVRSMEDEYHGSVGISWPLWIYVIVCIFVNIHGLNIYFYLSFFPAILVMLVGTKLQHVVAVLALEVVEAYGPYVGTQLKPRDDLFWFRKPELLIWLIQFISFQNAFEMATFIWSLDNYIPHNCLNANIWKFTCRGRLLVQFWCSYSTLPLNVIITQMGSKFNKSLIAESVRESLHSWCRRVKEKSRLSRTATLTSTCSLGSTIGENDETNTVGTLTPTPSFEDITLPSSIDDGEAH
ncbi:MLO-like protein 4 [Apostasia shenzhenica]|uniref:MLO-like protein n=1 Tax=Apostasia shenzhenica TaxID=1088818 RepID=A0A2I0APE0_9ASPA|nr:MLO-like protein 4 [Apostasia shenzhenica]